MPLKNDLLQKGYLPENLPPAFTTVQLGANLAIRTGWFTEARSSFRAAPHNASKRGMTRRVFSFVHPATAHDLAEFVATREADFTAFFGQSAFSLSTPRISADGDRAVEIATHSELEAERLSRLSRYRFIARTDISRFYHSIYTHSIPWAVHGKAASKADRRANSAALYMNRLDLIVRGGQDGQTIGIPVGPDASRYIAEAVCTAIDVEFVRRGGNANCDLLRHVDDVWIGADTHAAAEEALWRYREAIRAFELDINETKTAIYSDNFKFSDSWPTDIARKIEFASQSAPRRIPERLRAALEFAFALTSQNNDDGVLKYTLRYLDRSSLASTQWPVIEPFLKRAAVHFGHTIDYVARIIVWRQLVYHDLDLPTWSNILVAIIDRHGRLGNDSEVVWAIYAAIRLRVVIPDDVASIVIQNCGALSVVALLSCVRLNLVRAAALTEARTLIAGESSSGPYWPLILEWRSQRWAGWQRLQNDNALISNLAAARVSIFNASRLPSVFDDIDELDFGAVSYAIEERSSQYEDDAEEADEDDDDILF